MIYQVKVNEIGTFWRLNGNLHREDGPAAEWSDGSKEWYRNGKYHREDGPAIEWADGTKKWCRNGQKHREDGPAVERADGYKEWWLNGEQYTEEEFNRAIKKVIPEYTMEEAIKLIGHEFKIKK